MMRASFSARFPRRLGKLPGRALGCAVLMVSLLAAGGEPTAAEIEAAFEPAVRPDELAALEERYGLAREVARQEELEFDGKYRGALEQVRAKARGEGDLDGVLAADACLGALGKGAELELSEVPAVANLQRIRAASLPAVRAKSAAGLMKLEQARLKELEDLVPELVKRGDIKQAQRAKELAGEARKAIDELAAKEPAAAKPAVVAARTPVVVQWIWNTAEAKKGSTVFFRRSVEIPPGVKEAQLSITCDDSFELFLDGKSMAAGKLWSEPKVLDLSKQLTSGGVYVFAVHATNGADQAGLAFHLKLTLRSGEHLAIVSDASWKVSDTEKRGWSHPSYRDDSWGKAAVIAPMGAAPWGNVFTPKK